MTETYVELESVSSKLKKTGILSKLFSKALPHELSQIVLLVQGLVYPRFTGFELGIASQMTMRAISKATGMKPENVEQKFKKTGDLGLVAEQCIKTKRQPTLLRNNLTVDFVFTTLQRLATITGEGSQDRKLNLIAGLILSARPIEARYITRTAIGYLRVGAAEGIIRDAIANAFLLKKDTTKEEKKEITAAVEYAWNLLSDFGEVATIAKDNGLKGLRTVRVELGKPIQVMLAEKEESLEDVIKKYGKIAIEWKYDGMRAQIQKQGNEIKVYTRRLENVTHQFPDLVKICRKGIKANECIVEGEVLGVDKKGSPLPFQKLSSRIHRKYDIDKMVKEIPIQIHLFDIIFLNGEILLNKPLTERRKILEKNVERIPGKLELARQLVTDSLKEAEKFYEGALKARQEGVMLKVLTAPYAFGRHVDGWIKIKPVMESLDLVVIGATWGEGGRANWLTSYVLAARDPGTGILLEVGMMSTGLTEEEYKNMTKTLKPLTTKEKGRMIEVKPKVVVEVNYQEIQKSTNYDSGFALRFPTLSRFREDKSPSEADTISRVKKLFESQGKAG
ncbi:MAG: ATP-dependent DNA ligase [Nitrososphaerales archaeon]